MVVSSTVSHQVQGVEKCNVRKESTGFPTIEWRKYQPATCTQCVLEQHAGQASVRASKRASTGKQDVNNRPGRRPRAAHKRRLAAKDTASESDESAAGGADWDEYYGVRMSPANPRYVGRGDSICGGEVVYIIPDIKVPLRSQPDDAQRWLTTGQMGWSLTRERNAITNEKDEPDCKPITRQLAPMISKFIRAKWESHEPEGMDDERRQIIEEAAELDHIWGAWEAQAELTNDPQEWLKQSSLSRDDLRFHVEVQASHREQRWEPSSASLIERGPEVIP